MSKSKINTVCCMDRISKLPKSVICHILSFLSTEDAVRTSVLSTELRYLFASVVGLRFFDSEKSEGHKFTDFVNGALNREGLMDIILLDLDLSFGCYDITVINSWISAAIRRSVQEINVEVHDLMIGRRARSLVPDLFTCKTLVNLDLYGEFDLSVPESVYLPNLKTCCLRGTGIKFIDDGSTQRLFSGCPKLEKLTFVGCDMGDIMDLELHIPSLKMLDLLKIHAHKILLNVPNLEKFECSCRGANILFKGVCKSIVRANIVIEENLECVEENLSPLMNNLVEIKSLSLGSETIKLLQNSCCLLPMFNNLTHLEMENSGYKLLPKLLHKTPYLEVLVIHGGYMNDDVYDEITERALLFFSPTQSS